MHACQTLFITFGHEHECLSVSFWGSEEAFTIGILADALEHGPNGSGHLALAGELFLWGCIETRDGGLCW